MTSQSPINKLVLVVTTETNNTAANALALKILQQRLAVCVSLRDVQSQYWWDNELHKGDEVQLLIKTTKEKLQNLLNMINRLHTYEVPELLYWNVSVSS